MTLKLLYLKHTFLLKINFNMKNNYFKRKQTGKT